MVLIFISLMNFYIEFLFIYVLAICILFNEEPVQVFCSFKKICIISMILVAVFNVI